MPRVFHGPTTIRGRLALLVILPLLGLLTVGGSAIVERVRTLSDLQVVVPLANLDGKADAVIHEVQKERGRTVGLISGNWESRFAEAVAAQRRLTDPVVMAYREAVRASELADMHGQLSPLMADIESRLEGIAAHRAKVDARQMTVPDNLAFYTGLIEAMIRLMEKMSEASPSSELNKELQPYLALVKAKEHAGLERALGGNLFNAAARGVFDIGTYLAYHARLVGEQLFLADFQSLASPEHRRVFQETVKGPPVDQVKAWRAVLAELPKGGTGQGVDGKVWFDTATQRINMIKMVEDVIRDRAQAVANQALADAGSELWVLVGVVVGATVLALWVCFSMYRAITAPLPEVRRLTAAAMARDLTQRVEVEGRDEIAGIARALDDVVASFRLGLEEVAMASVSIAAASEELGRSSASLTDQAKSVSGDSTRADDASKDLTKAIADVSLVVRDLAEAAQTVAGAVTELNASIYEVAGHADQAAAAAYEVEATNTEVGQVMGQAQREMETARGIIEELNETASEVGDVIGVINDIANQTNLLALNATIEAARAGEMGKGFAVVAGEVKNLANQSAKATESITNRVTAIQDRVARTVDSIGGVGASIDQVQKHMDGMGEVVRRVNDIASAIAKEVAAQGEATDEISRNAEQVSIAALRLNENTEKTKSTADTMTLAVERISSSAEEAAVSAGETQLASEELAQLANRMDGLVSLYKLS
ncbi:methyl-accepting chemotaxis protein [Rhodospirillum sp. A1_3_36]|uniref:methyl-accepting chemotaxis protein n=1 Tax=Rhodospirillum sp. A1_3_36 TaxID=3391666 RepID=UPI0039A47761